MGETSLEEIRKQLTEDLADALDGELQTDPITRALYATDASLYEIRPLAVAFPRHTEDVSVLAAFASDNGIPLIPRGAGTGLAGGCLGEGIVVDFNRHLNRILQTGESTIRVQSGATLAAVNQHLRALGRSFAPDPSNADITTIGGMIGVDAAGSRAVRVGSTRDHVQSLQCVLMGGQTLELGREPVRRRFSIRPPEPGGGLYDQFQAGRNFIPPVRNETLALSSLTPLMRRTDVLERLGALLADSADLIHKHQPLLLRNCSGYMLRNILSRDALDLTRLLVGSEGSLAMVTEATLHTMPLDAHRGMLVVMFGGMDAALQAMQQLLVLEPSACDLMDRRLLSLGRDADSTQQATVHPQAEAGLFVEFTGSSETEVSQRLTAAEKMLAATELQFAITQKTLDPEEVTRLWQLPTHVVALLAGLRGSSRPLPFVEDIAVPPDSISDFLTLAQKTLQRHEVTATLYAHAASGQLHLRPMLPHPTPGNAARIEAIARDLYRHVRNVGGTISGEHGDGLSRTAFIRSMYGPLYRTFQQVKEIFDPQYLLNPDKVISNDGQLTIRRLRRVEPAETPTPDAEEEVLLPVLQLSWQPEDAVDIASRCNGCGNCRTHSDNLRMCPFFRDQTAENNSPRAKANLIRRLISGEETADVMTAESARTVAESCFNCKQCQLECPSDVDIPHLLLEARAQHVSAHGLGKTDWLLSRFHTYARFASTFTWLTNRMLRYGIFRRFLRRMLGIADQRRLPQFTSRPFMNSQRVLSEHNIADISSATPTVVYFVDYFANHHDPSLAEAFVRILQHNGYRVHIPQDQRVSGMAMIAVGDLAAAREVAEANVAELSECAREGFPIVCSEPSAALCLSQEYPLLLGSEDAEIIAQQTMDAGTFLSSLHAKGRLKTDFEPLELNVAYHTPCHVRALGSQAGLRRLLDLVPGLNVTDVEKGCTGMAGTFGLAKEHFEQSLEIGADLIEEMKVADVAAGTTDCSSCRMQMEQQATIPTLHPLKILALAYGLMPELRTALDKRPSGYLMS